MIDPAWLPSVFYFCPCPSCHLCRPWLIPFLFNVVVRLFSAVGYCRRLTLQRPIQTKKKIAGMDEFVAV